MLVEVRLKRLLELKKRYFLIILSAVRVLSIL